ncbi:MAG: WVD2 family protein [Polyangiales bacterium]
MHFARKGSNVRHTLRLAFLCWLVLTASAAAQTLEDTLRQHVREGIDDSEEKARKQREEEERKRKQAEHEAHPPPPKKEPAQKPATPEPPPTSGSSVKIDFGSDGDPLAQQAQPGPKLPLRVLGQHFQLDVTLGGGYRGWLPQQYRAVSVDVGNYATWNIDVKAKIYFVSLRRGYYESNGVAPPRTDEGAVASQVAKYAPKAVRLLGILGVPISPAWEPQIRYESHAFETRAVPSQDVCVVGRDVAANFDPATCKGTRNELRILSAFETFVAGVRYDHSRSDSPVVGNEVGKIPPIFFGIGLMQYRKPYQVNVGSVTANEFLFDGRFRGVGLALGTNLGGGVNNFFVDVDAQLGAGEVSLTDKLTLNALIPSGYTIGYVQGTATLGYRLALFKGPPTLLLVPVVSAGGASFFLVSTNGNDKNSTSPSVNWDLLWTAQASLLLPL